MGSDASAAAGRWITGRCGAARTSKSRRHEPPPCFAWGDPLCAIAPFVDYHRGLLLTDPPRPHPPHTLLSSSYLTLLTDSFCSSPSPSLATLPTHALSLPVPSHLYVLRHLLRHPSSNQAAIASRYEALVAARTDLPTEQELAGRIAALRVAASGMVQLELTQQERVLLERERLHRNDAGVQHEAMRAVTRVRAWVYANGKWLVVSSVLGAFCLAHFSYTVRLLTVLYV